MNTKRWMTFVLLSVVIMVFILGWVHQAGAVLQWPECPFTPTVEETMIPRVTETTDPPEVTNTLPFPTETVIPTATYTTPAYGNRNSCSYSDCLCCHPLLGLSAHRDTDRNSYTYGNADITKQLLPADVQ